MAEAFLARLPNVGRGILAKEDQHCAICMEEYGTVPSASGIIERAVRLSCNHIVGSECISIWLTTTSGQRRNSTCPVCRHVLYEVEQPRVDIDQEVSDHTQTYSDLDQYIAVLARHLDLNTDAAQMAAHIANRVHEQGSMGDHSEIAVAAASLYMASHAIGDPRSRRAFSRNIAIAGFGDVGADVLSLIYTRLYQDHQVLLHEPLLRGITPWTLSSVYAILPSPQT